VTDTPPADPPKTQQVQINVQSGCETVTGPDGKPWVKFHLGLGLAAITMIIPEELAEQLAPVLAQQLAEGAANARRDRIGLIVATNQQPLPPIRPGRNHG
jgi:hypothetical protein